MSGGGEILCRLCLKTVTDKSFEVIDDATRDILHFLLLKLKLDDDTKEVICNACRRKLYAASEFKSKCLNTSNTIIPYVDSEKMVQLHLEELYMKEKKSELFDISDSQKICRLCMQPAENKFRYIHEEELEAIQKLAPEMIGSIIKDHILCKTCCDSLFTHNSFLQHCMEIEDKIYDNSNPGRSKDISSCYLFVKTENLHKEFDINKMELSIKEEYVDIKSEDKEKSDTLLLNSHIGLYDKSDCNHENGPANKCNTRVKQECKVLYKCDKCIYETDSKSCFMAHRARHKNGSEMYKCNDYDYETKYKKNIKRHQLKHNDPSRLQMYRCSDCDYETKIGSNFKQHQLQHKNPWQEQIYKCNDCDYETKYKKDIEKHQLKHNDPLHVQIYRCDDCDFKTVYKKNIKRHQMKHKDPSQIQIYRCNDCEYETKYKGDIKEHQLKHNDPSEVQVYRCNDCDFKTIYKKNVKRHQLKHKDPSQVQIYGCNDCEYETKHKEDIKKHQLKHGDPSQLQTYKCNDCDFKTKYTRNMKRHQLKHKYTSQVQMYRCNDCDYKTKYRKVIKKHQLKHNDPSQVQMYKCNDYDYQTEYKGLHETAPTET
ncbi:zinc finger protein 845-like [Anoplophora glabripennis]|uniref:zinc finger protein 845-like n=1 Tax=Anoplophora glabripennis TaxID=217634 RepID=UPI000875A873|nr:zinc finger protein 845-like [Anoplophora glabripennis]